MKVLGLVNFILKYHFQIFNGVVENWKFGADIIIAFEWLMNSLPAKQKTIASGTLISSVKR